MTVRAALARLECSAARASMISSGPCACQGPQVVVHDERQGLPAQPVDRACGRCGRERRLIAVRIIYKQPVREVGVPA